MVNTIQIKHQKEFLEYDPPQNPVSFVFEFRIETFDICFQITLTSSDISVTKLI